MQNDDKLRVLKYLNDALLAAHIIHTDTGSLTVKDFHFTTTKWIVERGIEIISEALKRAIHIKPEISVSNQAKIFATRNKIAHEYDIVDPYQLFNNCAKTYSNSYCGIGSVYQ